MQNAYYAILISPDGFNEPRRRFLKHRSLLSYYGYRFIWVARLNEEILEYDKLLCRDGPIKNEVGKKSENT